MTAARRHRAPQELPAVVGFRDFARFEHVNAAENCARFYVLSLQPTPLGDVALVRTRGRIGTQGTSLSTTFADRTNAQETVERLVPHRIRRRYELVDWT